jgi:DNA-binding transcriptional LysR family regulator
MAIELRLLRYFAVVAEERHVGYAAARLFISQPALSQQIRALEEQVGVPLFVRHPRGMELTEAGEVLLQEARQVLASSERLEAAVEELSRGHTEGLRLGLPPGLPPGLLPDLLAALRDREPDARVEVRELTTPEQLAALRDGSLDLGLVREPVDRLSRSTLLVEPLGVSLPATHRLAERSELTLRGARRRAVRLLPEGLGAVAARRAGERAAWTGDTGPLPGLRPAQHDRGNGGGRTWDHAVRTALARRRRRHRLAPAE